MKKRYIQEKIYGSPGQYLMIDEKGELYAGVPDNASYPAILINVPDNCVGVNVYYPLYTKTTGVNTLNFVKYVYGTTKKLSKNMYVSTVPTFGTWTVLATLDNNGTSVEISSTVYVTELTQYSVTISQDS